MVINAQMCFSNKVHEARIGKYRQTNLNRPYFYPYCTCRAYQFGKRVVEKFGRKYPKKCKHIVEAENGLCLWNSAAGVAQVERGACPACGLETFEKQIEVDEKGV